MTLLIAILRLASTTFDTAQPAITLRWDRAYVFICVEHWSTGRSW